LVVGKSINSFRSPGAGDYGGEEGFKGLVRPAMPGKKQEKSERICGGLVGGDIARWPSKG